MSFSASRPFTLGDLLSLTGLGSYADSHPTRTTNFNLPRSNVMESSWRPPIYPHSSNPHPNSSQLFNHDAQNRFTPPRPRLKRSNTVNSSHQITRQRSTPLQCRQLPGTLNPPQPQSSPLKRILNRVGNLYSSSVERDVTQSIRTNVNPKAPNRFGSGENQEQFGRGTLHTPLVSGITTDSSNDFTPTNERRGRLRRECTLDMGYVQPVATSTHSQTFNSESGAQTIRTETIGRSLESIIPQRGNISQFSPRDPMDEELPDELRFTSVHFKGQLLVQWLCRQLIRTGHAWSYNLITLVLQICICLLRIGVLQLARPPINSLLTQSTGSPAPKKINDQMPLHTFDKFELNCEYKWTGQQATQILDLLKRSNRSRSLEQSISSMRQSLDAPQGSYGSSEMMDSVRREYDYEIDRLTRDHELQLFRVKNQCVMKVCQLTDRIEILEQEVEKYRILAGIEDLTKSPLLDDISSHSTNRTARYLDRYGEELVEETDQPLVLARREQKQGIRSVGFSLPDASIDQSSQQHQEVGRTRAVSDVSGVRDSSQFIAQKSQNVGGQKTKVMETHPMDELPRTKGFLKRLMAKKTSGSDSGFDDSRTSTQTDSQDVIQHSMESEEHSESERQQFTSSPSPNAHNEEEFISVRDRIDRLQSLDKNEKQTFHARHAQTPKLIFPKTEQVNNLSSVSTFLSKR